MIQPFSTVLPNNRRQSKKSYLYKIVDSIDFCCFINTTSIIEGVVFEDLALGIFDCGGNLIQDATSSLYKLDILTGYRLYIEGLTLTGLRDRARYVPKIYDTNDNNVYLYLKPFEFRSSPDGLSYVQYRNSTDINNNNYEALPSFKNKIFLNFSVVDIYGESDREEHTESTTNTIIFDRGQHREVIKCQAEFFDDISHQAMRGLLRHNDVTINYRSYTFKNTYEVEYNKYTNRYVGTFEIYDNQTNEVNSY